MIPYTFLQLVFFFLLYCFIGWIIESTYVSVVNKKFVNRGFMRGPVIPIYGCGAMLMLLVAQPVIKYPVAVFFAGLISCTILEYVTGYLMEKIFKVRYWDYSDLRFNINGYVCLGTSLSWGALTLFLNYILHKPVEYFVLYVITYPVLLTVTVIAGTIFIVDLTLSFKAAFDLRRFIIAFEKAKQELIGIKDKLNGMVDYVKTGIVDTKDKAFEALDNWSDNTEQKMENFSDGFDNRIAALSDNIEKTFLKLKDTIGSMPESMKEEFYELKAKFSFNNERRKDRQFFKDFYRRGIFEGNPTLSSREYKDAIEDIKENEFGIRPRRLKRDKKKTKNDETAVTK